MPHGNRRDAWQQDIQNRQRNIAFPDTVQNEGRFLRGILNDTQPLNRVQKIGAWVYGLLTLVIWASVLTMMVRGGAGVLGVALEVGFGVALVRRLGSIVRSPLPSRGGWAT